MHIQVLEADTVVKIFIVHPDHATVLFGYSPEATINDIWPDLASSFPNEVIFPFGCKLVESDMREMFAKNWEKAGFSNAALVLEVLLESETIAVFVEIDDVSNHMLSRFGTLVGDIFNHFIPMDELTGFQFIGHNESEIICHEGDWVSKTLLILLLIPPLPLSPSLSPPPFPLPSSLLPLIHCRR